MSNNVTRPSPVPGPFAFAGEEDHDGPSQPWEEPGSPSYGHPPTSSWCPDALLGLQGRQEGWKGHDAPSQPWGETGMWVDRALMQL